MLEEKNYLDMLVHIKNELNSTREKVIVSANKELL